MKFLIFLLALAVIAKAKNSESNENGNSLQALNQSVQLILSVSSQPVSGKKMSAARNLFGVQYFYDILPPTVQILLLNQTQVMLLGFNVTQQLQLNISNLSWSSLPANVQSFLLSQQGSLLNLRFDQWGWASLNGSFSDSTLLSLFQLKYQIILSNVSVIIAPLKYNLQVDLSKLNQTLYSQVKKPKGNLVNGFFCALFDYLEDLIENTANSYTTGLNRFLNNPAKVYLKAVSNAMAFLKSLKIKAKF